MRIGRDNRLLMLVVALAFSTGFSLTLGRFFAAALLIACVVEASRGWLRLRIPAVAWIMGAFILWAVWVTVTGPNPDTGVGRLTKLLWYAAIALTASVIRNADDAHEVLQAYAAGAALGAVLLVTGNTLGAWLACRAATQAGETADFMTEWIHRGGMTDGQILMLGVVISVAALCQTGLARRARLVWGALLAIQLVGLVVNFKRGSWAGALVAAALLLALRGRRRALVGAVAVALVALLLPGARGRLGALRDELNLEHGGRLAMWTRIAPELRRRYPGGVGFRSLTSEMMQEAAEAQGVYVEPGRNHLHANVIQILVATGVPGLLLYLAWTGMAVWYGVMILRSAAGPPVKRMAECLLAMLVALFGNGLVEYNVADARIVLSYSLVMGLLAALWRVGALDRGRQTIDAG